MQDSDIGFNLVMLLLISFSGIEKYDTITHTNKFTTDTEGWRGGGVVGMSKEYFCVY